MVVSDIGYLALLLAFALAVYSCVASAVGARWRIGELVTSARNAVWANSILMVLAAGILVYGFLSHDYGLQYVLSHSNRAMPWYYVASAFWGGQEGSLLYWATVLGVFSGVAVFLNRRRYARLMPYVISVLSGVMAFFLVVLVFVTNPFQRMPFAMPDGQGLNPILQDPGMMFHPPLLLMGYMSWSIPFAFVIAALVTGRLGMEWVRAIRRWTLTAWTIQSAGLLLGGWWAYHVLGWGGYWGWDPVENVAFLPWVMGTAFLHSVMVVEKRGKLKVWTISLVIAAFLLAIFGTFVVRSGVLSSVHSFAESPIGPYFLAFLAGTLVLSIGLLVYRLPSIRDEEGFDSLVSRESGFLANNLLLVGVAFATFWGTIYPLISEAVSNTKLTVGPPFYEQVNAPLFFILLLLMGIAPLLAWRHTTTAALIKNFRIPAALALLALVATFALTQRIFVALGFSGVVFVFGTIILDYARGVSTRRRNTRESYPEALSGLVARDRARYGGYVVHLGIAIIAVGIIGSSAFQEHKDINIREGESVTVGVYTLTYTGSSVERLADREGDCSTLAVVRDGQYMGAVTPMTEYFPNFPNPSSKVAILTTPLDDLYVFQASKPQDGQVTLSIFVNPLTVWVWVGGSLLFIGYIICAWPEPRPVRVTYGAPEGATVSGS